MFKVILSFAVMTGVFAAPSSTDTDQEANPLTVEQAARRFRIESYQRFRLNRAEFDRRLEAAESLLEMWSDAGMPQQRSAEVVGWFDQAGRMTQANTDFPESPRLPKKPPRAKLSREKSQGEFQVELYQDGQEEEIIKFDRRDANNDPTVVPHIPDLKRMKVDSQEKSGNPFVDDPPNFLKSTKPVNVDSRAGSNEVEDPAEDSKSSKSGFLNPTKFLRGFNWSKLRSSSKNSPAKEIE